jgi:ribonuclease P protein component
MDRLRTTQQFRRVYDEGRRYAADLLVLYRRPVPGVVRVGIAVGRRVGKVVTRNLVRRRLREILRRSPLAADQEVVIVARERAASVGAAALRSETRRLLRASGALCTAPGAGEVEEDGDG